MRLVIFDVDGTLTRSTAVDAVCYARAVSEHLALQIDTDWSSYREATDAGILRELLQRYGIVGNSSDIATVQRRFVDLLSAALATDSRCCLEVPGARAFIASLREVPGFRLAIATGAWGTSARLKLRHADLRVDRLPFGSSDDSPVREEILRIAFQRAAGVTAGGFDAVTYIGDGPWDVAAARSSGFHFIGIACDGDESRLRSAGAPIVFADFADHDAFVHRLLVG